MTNVPGQPTAFFAGLGSFFHLSGNINPRARLADYFKCRAHVRGLFYSACACAVIRPGGLLFARPCKSVLGFGSAYAQ